MTLIVQFLVNLRSNYVHPICVFDGQSHPLKQSTVQKRRIEREKGKNRLEELKGDIERYKETGSITETFQKFLNNHEEFVSKLTQQPLINRITEHIDKQYKNYNIHFRTSEIDSLKEVIGAMGICVITAEYDGEALCSYLSANDQVDVVLSNDSDVFFFGCKKVIFKFTDEGGYLICLDDILTKLNLSTDQFIDLCLLCGTDFNTPIRGIGFVKAYNLIKEFHSLNNTALPVYNQLDHTLLDSVRNMYSMTNQIDISYSKPSYDSELGQLLFKNQIRIPLDCFTWFNTSILIDSS